MHASDWGSLLLQFGHKTLKLVVCWDQGSTMLQNFWSTLNLVQLTIQRIDKFGLHDDSWVDLNSGFWALLDKRLLKLIVLVSDLLGDWLYKFLGEDQLVCLCCYLSRVLEDSHIALIAAENLFAQSFQILKVVARFYLILFRNFFNCPIAFRALHPLFNVASWQLCFREFLLGLTYIFCLLVTLKLYFLWLIYLQHFISCLINIRCV